MDASYSRMCCLAVGLIGLMALSACVTARASEKDDAKMEAEAAEALTRAKTGNPTLANVLNAAAGYAVFPKVAKGGMGIGAAHGKGVLYVGGNVVGYCSLSQTTVGLQLGGKSYTEIIAFENAAAVDGFKAGNFHLDAQATAVAVKAGTAVDAKYTNGVAVYTLDQGGLMFEASVGGQKFSYRAK